MIKKHTFVCAAAVLIGFAAAMVQIYCEGLGFASVGGVFFSAKLFGIIVAICTCRMMLKLLEGRNLYRELNAYICAFLLLEVCYLPATHLMEKLYCRGFLHELVKQAPLSKWELILEEAEMASNSHVVDYISKTDGLPKFAYGVRPDCPMHARTDMERGNSSVQHLYIIWRVEAFDVAVEIGDIAVSEPRFDEVFYREIISRKLQIILYGNRP